MATIFPIDNGRHDFFRFVLQKIQDLSNGADLIQVPHANNTETQRRLRENLNIQQTLVGLRADKESLAILEKAVGDAKKSVTRRLNDIAQNIFAPINVLPNGTLREIFSYLTWRREGNKNNHHHESASNVVTVTHVCSRWRGVALGHAGLWTAVDLAWPSAKAEAWISRSRSLPLSMKVHISLDKYYNFHFTEDSENSEVTELVVQNLIPQLEPVIFRHAQHFLKTYDLDIRLLEESMYSPDLFDRLLLPFTNHSFPRLHTLKIDLSYKDGSGPSHKFPIALPSTLREVYLDAVDLNDAVSFPNVTALTLVECSLSYEGWECMFWSCAALERLTLYNVGINREFDRSRPWGTGSSLPVVIPRLRTLDILRIPNPLVDFFADCCDMPELRSLFFDGDLTMKLMQLGQIERLEAYCNRFTFQNIKLFFRTLLAHASLQDLHLHNFSESDELLKKFVSRRIASPLNAVGGGKALRVLGLHWSVYFQRDVLSQQTKRWLMERVQYFEEDTTLKSSVDYARRYKD